MASDLEKKGWTVKTADGQKDIKFIPIFKVTETPEGTAYAGGLTKEVECRLVDIFVPDENGKELNYQMNYPDLFMFVYMCADEELRRQLQMRWDRQATSIPYEVTFTLSPDEIQSKMAKRLITLTVDEITLAIARAGANKLLKTLKPESTEAYVQRKTAELKIKK